jgi:cytochrome c-type biogenesis protein CcmH
VRRVLLALVLLVFATGAAPRATLPDIEDEVMCVECRTALNVSTAPVANQERQFIREKIAQGLTKKQIKDRLVAQYGPSILATPQDHGFSLAAYLVPIAAVLAALVALAIAIPRWRRRRPPAGSEDDAAPAMTAADARRLDEDLARFGA